MLFYLKVVLCFLCFLAGCRQKEEPLEVKETVAVCIEKAKDWINARRPREAVRALEGCMRQHGNSPDIAELLASAYLMNGDDELAAFYFEETASMSELKYYCYLKASEIYEKLLCWDQALPCYELYLKALPEDSEVQVKYAQSLIKEGRDKKALEVLVRYAGDDIEARIQIAELFFKFGNYIQSRNWYLAALELDKSHEIALKNLWKIYSLLRDKESMAEIGSQFLEAGYMKIDGVAILACVNAYRELKKSLAELNKEDFSNFSPVELPLICMEAFPAQKAGEGILQNPPKEIYSKNERMASLEDLVESAKERGDYDEAITNLWKILGLNGSNALAWADLTECLKQTNKYDIAEMAIQEAIKIDPKNIDFNLTYLDIVLRTHNSEEYVRILRDVKRKIPLNAEVRLLWAKAQEVYMEDAAGAKRAYEKFLNTAPATHPEVVRVKNLLKSYQGLL